MGYKTKIGEAAQKDLEQIVAHLIDNQSSTALETVQEIRRKIEALSELPFRGVVYKEPFRLMTLRNKYRIYYTVDDISREVYVVNIFTPSQNRP